MTRTVHVDGRWWLIRGSVNWSEPATAQEFEHDVAAGGMSGAVMLVLVVVMVLTVVLWTPAGVVVPTMMDSTHTTSSTPRARSNPSGRDRPAPDDRLVATGCRLSTVVTG